MVTWPYTVVQGFWNKGVEGKNYEFTAERENACCMNLCLSFCLSACQPSFGYSYKPSLSLLVPVTVRLNPLISFLSLSQPRLEPCTSRMLWQAGAFYKDSPKLIFIYASLILATPHVVLATHQFVFATSDPTVSYVSIHLSYVSVHLGYVSIHLSYVSIHLGYVSIHLSYVSIHLSYVSIHLSYVSIHLSYVNSP